MNFIERVRVSGKCLPSLICVDSDEDFETTAVKVVDANELYLSFETTVPVDFMKLLELTSSNTENISADSEMRNAILVSRRSIVLTLVASTPIENTMLGSILQNGYLSTVNLWMSDILRGSVGGIDLLLHLLTKISLLPVTKLIVKNSGWGKALGSIEKHRICADSPNKVAIVERVNAIKDAWRKSVKMHRLQNNTSTSDKTSLLKRGLESSSQPSSPTAKKIKLDDTKKSSFSSLLKKVDPDSVLSAPNKSSSLANGDSSKKVAASKKLGKRLKWKDHFGGKLEASKIINDETLADESADETSGSWSDRKKRDRLREKELIAKAKKAKLSDDDDDEVGREAKLSMVVQPTVTWHVPPLLPDLKDAPSSHNNSKEKIAQTTRMASVIQAAYLSEHNVPMNPAPLSDVEQALDMTSQSSIVSQAIPFFVTQASAPQAILTSTPASYTSPQAQPGSGMASAETVQALGLPSFLAGRNLQALQTLASTPKLLESFVDSNGMYDQVRLMNLVQTLSQNSPTSGQHNQRSNAGFQQAAIVQNVPVSGRYGQTPENGGMYGLSSGQGAYGNNNWQGNGVKSGGYRGAQNSSEGNLHLSGYGPGTTQSEIIALFSPYVQVSEVVMKATFSFVNTNDPMGAKQAREALNGALLGGTPVRINMAQRKNRDTNQNFDGYGNGVSNAGSHYGRNTGVRPPNGGFPGINNPGFGQSQIPPPPIGLPPGQTGGDPSLVRDDRGNPATKNLFVAGYGQGTTETNLREIFSAHTQIVGIISKGTFSFINTNDKLAAIHAREVLSGTMLNGGVLRINFAKETGRLGTSFDLTYGGPGEGEGGGGGQNRSHYGRSY